MEHLQHQDSEIHNRGPVERLNPGSQQRHSFTLGGVFLGKSIKPHNFHYSIHTMGSRTWFKKKSIFVGFSSL
ncbi:Hypothetical predicted protein [Octopus vulgaris]|uniref:Uncharacterized protein n=1 Tax=Octopus vulgaris TaxID=6645 RepID=A0AA36F9D4_OCTVU|nr:Hypothetical predicted protein [Octopus vulgaris]